MCAHVQLPPHDLHVSEKWVICEVVAAPCTQEYSHVHKRTAHAQARTQVSLDRILLAWYFFMLRLCRHLSNHTIVIVFT